MFKCEICGREFETIFGLSCHIRKHKISREEYYLKYLGEKGKCAECGKDTNFLTIVDGYCKFCSRKCSNGSDETKNKMKETCMKNNKCEYAMQSEKVREKSKVTNLKKYNVENVMQNKE